MADELRMALAEVLRKARVEQLFSAVSCEGARAGSGAALRACSNRGAVLGAQLQTVGDELHEAATVTTD